MRKTTDNIIVSANGNPRPAFYPFSNDDYSVEVSFRVTDKEEELSLNNVKWYPDYSCNGGPDDRLRSWVEVYKIDSRYVSYSLFNETVWRETIIQKYKGAIEDGEDFAIFKNKYLRQFKSKLMRPLDLLEKAYAEYFLNKPNIEVVLAEWNVI